ncbi:MAG: NAD(P)-dependent oxidoreductase [Pseudomonadota bacterium]
MTHLAILGLGAMGSRMAHRLLAAGHTVTVWNRNPGPVRELAERGASPADSPAAAVSGAAGVIAVLRDDEASRSVWLDRETGALRALKSGAWAVESSTLSVDWVKDLAGAAASHKRLFVDAPVLGSRPQAEAGQLVHLLGGSDDAVARVSPVLAQLGQAQLHAGPTGAGTALKLLANTLFGIQVAAVAELLNRSRELGLDPQRSFAQLGETPVMSPAAKGAAGLMLAGRHEPLFPVELVAKDFSYAIGSHAATLPVSNAAAAVFAGALGAGMGDDNLTTVARLYADRELAPQ